MPETIGQRLKHEREARHLTLEKAAEATRVRAHFLQALENDDYSAMSSAAQGRGFLRLYAEFLALDLEAAMDDLRSAVPSAVLKASDTPADSPKPDVPDATSALVAAPEPIPASPTDGKPARSGFWARLLRRPSSESPADSGSPVEAAGSKSVEESAAHEPEPAPAKVTGAKSAGTKGEKKTGKTSRTTTVDEAKPEAPVARKKKQSLKPNPNRQRLSFPERRFPNQLSNLISPLK